MPPLAILPALIAAGAGVAGAVESGQAAGAQQKGLSIQEQLAQQQMQDKQRIFNQLQPFFSQYLKQGSPFLSMIQRASGEQNAQQFNNAAGQVRSNAATSGLGFGPSGTTAAALGGLGTQAAQTSSSDYLTNLLNNENLKFQAAQGLQGIGSMAGSGQNQPSVSTQLPYQSQGSAIGALGQTLANLLKQIPGQTPQQTPQSVPGGQMGDILNQTGVVGIAPGTTGGYGGGGGF